MSLITGPFLNSRECPYSVYYTNPQNHEKISYCVNWNISIELVFQ